MSNLLNVVLVFLIGFLFCDLYAKAIRETWGALQWVRHQVYSEPCEDEEDVTDKDTVLSMT